MKKKTPAPLMATRVRTSLRTSLLEVRGGDRFGLRLVVHGGESDADHHHQKHDRCDDERIGAGTAVVVQAHNTLVAAGDKDHALPPYVAGIHPKAFLPYNYAKCVNLVH